MDSGLGGVMDFVESLLSASRNTTSPVGFAPTYSTRRPMVDSSAILPDDDNQAATVARNIAALRDYENELFLQDLAPITVAKYRQCLRSFLDWLGSRPITVQNAKYFLAYLRQEGYKPQSVRMYYRSIRPFFEYIGMSFKVKLRLPKTLPSYHPAQQIAALLQAAGDQDDPRRAQRDYAIILTLVLTGLRRAELNTLRPADIQNGYVHVIQGKGSKDRMVPVVAELAGVLGTYIRDFHIQPSGRLFRLTTSGLYDVVKDAAERAGIPDVTPHSLRHAFATTLLERGVDIKSISALLGHANIATTSIYLDVVPQHLKTAIDVLQGAFTGGENTGTPNVCPSEVQASAEAQAPSLSEVLSPAEAGSSSLRKGLRRSLSSTAHNTPAGHFHGNARTSNNQEDVCGSNSAPAIPSTARSTSRQSAQRPNTGQAVAPSSASARDARTVPAAIQSAGDTRRRSSSRARSVTGSSATTSCRRSPGSSTSSITPTSSSPATAKAAKPDTRSQTTQSARTPRRIPSLAI